VKNRYIALARRRKYEKPGSLPRHKKNFPSRRKLERGLSYQEKEIKKKNKSSWQHEEKKKR